MPLYCKPQITFSLTGGGRVNVMVGTKANRDKAVEEVRAIQLQGGGFFF